VADSEARELQIGQYIREEGPQNHQKKAGTPTMGGVAHRMSTVVPTLLWADWSTVRVAGVVRRCCVRRDRIYRRLREGVKERNLGLSS